MKLRILLSSFVALASLTLFAKAEPLAVGAPAPDVSAIDQDGKPVNFKDVYAKGPTLVYFYPKADTPGCTKVPHTLIADADGKVAAAFQVTMKGTMTSRQSFLVKDGKIVWNMLKASTDTQAKDVLAAYEALGKK